MEARNRFEKSLWRISRTLRPEDGWTQEDIDHLKTIIEALEICSNMEEERKKSHPVKGGFSYPLFDRILTEI